MLTENSLKVFSMNFSKEMTNKMIEFINVTKKFGDFIAVEDISFKVEPSSIYGLIGYNGANIRMGIHYTIIFCPLVKP